MGVDSAADLRKATRDVKKLQETAFENLADIRVSIETGFLSNKPRRAELLNDLGYNKYNDAARKHNQEALINFLQQFAKAATSDVQAELIAEDANADTLAAILAAAEPFTLAELAQEGFKSVRPETTAEAVNAYNNVYEEVIAIARNATRDFKNDPVVQKQFSYSHVLKQLNAQQKEETQPKKEG